MRGTGPERWLVFRLGAMGDVLLLTGVLEHWGRERGLRFTVVTRDSWAQVFTGHPAVDRVIGLNADELTFGAFFRFSRELAGEMSRKHPGMGLLDLHGVTRSRILRMLWKGPVRRYPKYSLERRLHLLFRPQGLRARLERWNTPQRYAMALDTTPPGPVELMPRMWFQDRELNEAEQRLRAVGLDKRPRIALHPFATHPAKAWPGERWLELVRALDSSGLGWYFMGRGELPRILRQVADDSGASFVNQGSVRESAALLACSELLVTGDSGPMHLAGGAGTPVVALFGPTTRAWGFMPPELEQGGRARVLQKELDCRPCSLHGKGKCPRNHECLTSLGAEDVLNGIREVLHAQRSGK